MKTLKNKNILFYLIKVIILFLILYFTFEKPTWLVLVAYISLPIYIGIYILILLVLSKIFNPYSKSNNFFKRHILHPILLLVGVGILFVLFGLGQDLSNVREDNYINNFINNADEIIFYNINQENYVKDANEKIIHEGGYITDTILIDYDTMKIAFIYGRNEFIEFKLEETDLFEFNQNIQQQIELNTLGNIFISYYPSEKDKHRTSGIKLVLNNGKKYSVQTKDGNYYLGLDTKMIMLKTNNY